MGIHSHRPMPDNEYDRIVELADYGLDYAGLQGELGGLTQLAASIAGAKISMVNLIDHYTQWSVARVGTEITQTPREDSVCQYTIMGDEPNEIDDLSADPRFADKFYVQGEDGLRYYYGVPLKNHRGMNLGALCVLDSKSCKLGQLQEDQIRMVARAVIERLERIREIHHLKMRLQDHHEKQRKVSHDIRGPLSGIIGLAEISCSQLEEKGDLELAGMMAMIRDSGQSVIDLADGILHGGDTDAIRTLDEVRCTLRELENSLLGLFVPQAKAKGVDLRLRLETGDGSVSLSKNQLLQVCGNLISNAIKYTPAGGSVETILGLHQNEHGKRLRIRISDTGIGMSDEVLADLRIHGVPSKPGTAGELGYGLGIPLVKRLVGQMSGVLSIDSSPGSGCTADVDLPV